MKINRFRGEIVEGRRWITERKTQIARILSLSFRSCSTREGMDQFHSVCL